MVYAKSSKNCYLIPTRIDVALKIVTSVNLSHPVFGDALVEVTGVSRSYVHQCCTILVNNNILLGKRGYRGGYLLARSPEDIKVIEVINAVSKPEDRANITRIVTKHLLEQSEGLTISDLNKEIEDEKH